MQDNKTFASLTPTLLARKGGARPAMRPQIQPLHAFHENAARDWQDDLGWNDMGAPADNDGGDVQPVTGEVVAFDPALAAQARAARPARPEVLRQQEAIAERIAPAPAIQHTPAGESATVRRSALADGRRAAFTLRLDSERHLQASPRLHRCQPQRPADRHRGSRPAHRRHAGYRRPRRSRAQAALTHADYRGHTT
jgi:hypothetical protein